MERLIRTLHKQDAEILDKALSGEDITAEEACQLYRLEGQHALVVIAVADELRRRISGDIVTYVINRNINFTNYCIGQCLFCCFKKNTSGDTYTLSIPEVLLKVKEAVQEGATEVCLQGGLNPHLETSYYYHVCNSIKNFAPSLHIHAFSPMEIQYIAGRESVSVKKVLENLKASGLDSMPGTAAEILHDTVRQVICPSKLTTDQWIEVVKTAHYLGIKSSSTMMYGHTEEPWHRIHHLDVLRKLHKETGGFTEFIPLSFVFPNTRLYKMGLANNRVSALEEMKIHAMARIMLQSLIPNIQVSWVKLGQRLAQLCLCAGANDLGGTLMEENISSSAGSNSPSKMSVAELRELIYQIEREPCQRTTLYDNTLKDRDITWVATKAMH